MGDNRDNSSELKATLDADIERGGMTITQFMSRRRIEGGVALDGTGKSSSSAASSVLVDQAGRKYDIGKVVASGGMGAILQAKDMNIRRTVAMKVLLDPKQADEDQILRFIEEAQITGQMEHPSIVPVHELGVDASGNVFYTMKFVKGVTLDEILDDIKEGNAETIAKYPLNILLNIFLKMCDAVAFAHTKNVVHRDLKPENIMVGEFGEVLVMDWGLGKVLGRNENEEDAAPRSVSNLTLIDSARAGNAGTGLGAMTLEGQVMGTPLYMAPEQAYGRVSEIDHRTDIYALGAILYRILTLHPPVDGDTVNAILVKVVQGKIEPPTRYGRSHRSPLPHLPAGHVPAALSHVAMKAMSLEKQDRYQAVRNLQKDIEAYQGGFATKAERAGWIRRGMLLAKRHKGLVAASAVVLLLVMVFGSYAGWEWYKKWGKWSEVYKADFTKSNPDLRGLRFTDYRISADVPEWPIEPGKGLKMKPFEWLWLKDIAVRGDVRVLAEISCADNPEAVIICINSNNREMLNYNWLKWYVPPGYSIQVGGYKGKLDQISRNSQFRAADGTYSALSGLRLDRPSIVLFQRQGETLGLSVDGREEIKMADPLPIVGEGLENIGFKTFSDSAFLRSLTIYRLTLAETSSPLVAGDALAEKGHLLEAAAKYLTIAGDYHDSLLGDRALLKAFLAASNAPGDNSTLISDIRSRIAGRKDFTCRPEFLEGESLYLWRTSKYRGSLDDVSEVFKLNPDTRIALRVLQEKRNKLPAGTGDELLGWLVKTYGFKPALGIMNLGLNNLDKVKGMPLSTLICSFNQITSLEPLKGMPLNSINCGYNQITSLEPLKGMSLNSLNFGNNHITSLEPLKGMPLTDLECGANQIASLEPLEGIPLTNLNCGYNQITSLEPLKGMSLNSLNFSNNQTRSLEPLDGMPLNNLNCGFNQITSLDPLKGMLLDYLCCGFNQITSLNPLKGMPLEFLECSDNRLHDLGPFFELPPKVFIFDNDTLSDAYLQKASALWRSRPEQSHHALTADMYLAIRHRDITALKSLATPFNGHRYLFVQKFMSWPDASKLAHELGGHLAIIESREENEFIAGLNKYFPQISGWLGVLGENGVCRLPDGKKAEYTNFNILYSSGNGSTVYNFSDGLWVVSNPDTKTAFIVEWDE